MSEPVTVERTPDDALFPETKIVTIDGTEITIPPLNLHALKQVISASGTIAQPLQDAYAAYLDAKDKWIAWKLAPVDGEAAVPQPNNAWWVAPIGQCLDDVYALLHVCIARANPTLSKAWLEEHVLPTVHLPIIVPAIVEVNRLAGLIKKALASEGVQQLLRSRETSSSPTSSSTSVSTTESSPSD